MKLADNLKTLRKFRSLTQEKFSKEIGIKRCSLGAYEEGRATPDIETLLTICDYFNITLDDLVKKELVQTIKAKDSEL